MAIEVLYDADADLSLIQGRKVAIRTHSACATQALRL